MFSLSRQNPFGLLPFERRKEGASKKELKTIGWRKSGGGGKEDESTFEGGFLFFPMIHNILPLQIIPQSMEGGEFGFLGGE